ncbi:NAD-dependent epimerase/dehydratase family protein [Micromonospora sp. AB353]|uniref:NAD-dependent epimerase/dehydratase family protein n=1 Tax=Micromonospora sp. AB353 TaxID=3413282 RepID=UPI003C179238
MSRIAVIGATGSVGRQICARFAEDGQEVLAVARGHAARVGPYPFVARDVAADDAAELARFLRSHDVRVVVNAAGRWGPTRAEMLRSHLGVAQRLAEARSLMDDPPRLIHLGTVHEYGPAPAGVDLDERQPVDPGTPYAMVKVACSMAVLAAGGVVLRCANMFGPHPPEETFFAAVLRRLRAASRDRSVVELTVADARRDFVDVRDVAGAVLAAASAPVEGQVLNIGSGHAHPLRELVDGLIAEAGVPASRVRITEQDVPSHGGGWIRVDSRAAQRLTGWRPRYTARESLRAMWAQV